MSAFTPGPWEIDTNNAHTGSVATVYGTGPGEYTEIWSRRWMDRPRSLDPEWHACRRADARLIAASPDLLAELQHLVRLLEPLERDGSLHVPGLATLNGARAAIAKAGAA